MRLKEKFWRWVAGRVNPYIPARYGVTLSNNYLSTSDGKGPPIEVGEDFIKIRGDVWERPT